MERVKVRLVISYSLKEHNPSVNHFCLSSSNVFGVVTFQENVI